MIGLEDRVDEAVFGGETVAEVAIAFGIGLTDGRRFIRVSLGSGRVECWVDMTMEGG